MRSLIICANALLFTIVSILILAILTVIYKITALLSPQAAIAFVCFQVPFFVFVLSAFSLHFSIEKYSNGKTDKKFKEFFPVYFKSVRLLTVLFLGSVIIFKLKHIFPQISLRNIEEVSVTGWVVGLYTMLLACICPDPRPIKKTSVETANSPKYIRFPQWARWPCLFLSISLIYWSAIFTLAFFTGITSFDNGKGFLPFWCGTLWVVTLIVAPGGLEIWAHYIKISNNRLDHFSLLNKNKVIIFEDVTDITYETMEVTLRSKVYYTFQFTLKDSSTIKCSYTPSLGAAVLEELKLHKQLNVHKGNITPERERKLIKYAGLAYAALIIISIIFKINRLMH